MLVQTMPQPEVAPPPSARHGAWSRRVLPAILFCFGAAVLTVAAWLTPDPSGTGTHEQLGLPACGFLQRTGLPCPTCGYTTACALAAHGRIVAALRTQPAGATLALLLCAMTIVSGYALLTGTSLTPLTQFMRPLLFWAVGALVLGAWVYKILLVTHKL